MLSSTVADCVIATNQTYVETLKKEGKFDLTAQKTAYEMTKTAVMSILTEEAKKYLTLAVGDLNIYISQLIESAVNTESLRTRICESFFLSLRHLYRKNFFNTLGQKGKKYFLPFFIVYGVKRRPKKIISLV